MLRPRWFGVVTLSLLCLSGWFVRAASPVVVEPEREVELFAAMRDGHISVELSALSSRNVWLKVTNKTDSMLRIALPKSFAGVPVLAQFGPLPGGAGLGPGIPGIPGIGPGNNIGGLGNVGGNGLAGGGQGGQGVGGGFNNPGNANGIGLGNQNGIGNGIGNAAQGRGIFRVPAGQVGKVHAQTVCLEHGKAEPTPHMKYRIVPLDEFTSGNARITKLCEMLAEKRVTQNVAQAVAWHIANGLTWEQLAAKSRARERYFSDEELQTALSVSTALQQLVQSPNGSTP